MHFTVKSKENKKTRKYGCSSVKIDKIPRESKLKVLKIVWAKNENVCFELLRARECVS